MGHVELHRFAARARTGIGYVAGNGQRFIRVQRAPAEQKVFIGKVRIGKSIAKRVTNGLLRRVIVAISDVNAFAVFHRARIAGEVGVGGNVLQPNGPALGELAGGANLAGDQICRRAAKRLTAQVEHQDCRRVRLPAHVDDRTACEQHHDVFVDRADAANKLNVTFRQVEFVPVEALGLKPIRQADVQQRRVHTARNLAGFAQQRLVGSVALLAIARGIFRVQAELDQLVQRAVHRERNDLAAARSLIARRFGERADHGDARSALERQHVSLVLEQHRACSGGFPRESVVLRRIERPGRNRRALERQLDHACCAGVHRFLRQRAGTHRFHDLSVVIVADKRHLEIESGGNAGDAVVHRAPVRHHQPLKAEFCAKHIRQQPAIVAGVDALDAVVGTHHRPGLLNLNGTRKTGEIEFKHRALVHNRIHGQAPQLLAVERKVFHARADLLALNARDIGAREFAGDDRVLAEILKVSAAERATFDV